MTSSLLPSWLPDWVGAEEISAETNSDILRMRVGELIDLVFTEDTIFLDSLSESLESALISPLGILGQIHDMDADPVELVVACRLVRRSVIPYLDGAPESLRILIEALPE
ncbi:hypothetical protein GXW83_02900 [Streptacidiphilus sp. PB12-B1b]|uniref:hypothetical protein n=1 Tax=Streptacidiphilus sp. PB12-B1b TaxID=2705012 RepID=UPI0015FE2504|nr:hypothetical protein [Streptacidiphilus sp. PB12-B1b]QMU74874.1 hypothetical protein GXW83_02900 [Streptacidiphilus sp. PB12-B1b]